MKDALQSTLRQLRLSGLTQTLDVRLQEAATYVPPTCITAKCLCG